MRRIVRDALLFAALSLASCGTWSLRAPDAAPTIPDPSSWSANGLTVAWLGHASVLIDLDGTHLLTDPTLYDRIGLSVGPLTIGPKRMVANALPAEKLPKISAILISHAHMDSLDRPSLARLAPTVPLLVVPERTRDVVDDLGFGRVAELRWGESIAAGEVTVEAVEVNHWGKRWPWERWRGYAGYLVRRGDTSVLFASDTAFRPELAAFAKQRSVTVMVLGIGAYDPWIMNHEDPEQAWQTFVASGAKYLIPIHWDTFRLGKEPLGDALRRLLAAAGTDADRVVIRRIGETWSLPARR